MPHRKRLGEIFVEQGIITATTVERVLALSTLSGRRFGTILEEMSLITGEELAEALAIQYGFKIIGNLANHSYPTELLQLIPAEVAMNNLLFPIRREGNKLALAMADPTDTKVVANIAANNGLAIVPLIATRTDIHAAICRHYLGREPNLSSQKTVLIVEDDNMERTMLSDLLSKNGYRVVTAHDGLEGFKGVIAEKPQVVITDRMMPKLDGFGLFDAMQKVPETMYIPVIMITATMDAKEEAQAFARGFFDFIRKPIQDTTLLTRVERAFFFHEHHYHLN